MLASEENVKDLTHILDFLMNINNSSSGRHRDLFNPLLNNYKNLLERFKKESELLIKLNSLRMQGFDIAKYAYADYYNYSECLRIITELLHNADKLISLKSEIQSRSREIPPKAQEKLMVLIRDPANYQEVSKLWNNIKQSLGGKNYE